MSKVYFLKCKVELGKHAFKLLIRALSFTSPFLYKQRSTLLLIHCVMQCKGEGGEAARYSATVLVYFSKEKDSKTLLQCWYISAKKRTASTLLQCWYISTKKRTTSICYSAGIYQYKKAAYQDSKYLVTVLMHDSKKGQLDSRKGTASIL
jgi:hypothetical protein